jgi:Putative beta-barrel porin-2, OmpL-like. bbp2/Carboxypeptidase regulatory-like domain
MIFRKSRCGSLIKHWDRYWKGSILVLALGLLPVQTRAADPGAAAIDAAPGVGAITGILTDSAKAPIAHATVTATRQNGSSVRATITGADGTYSFADLPAGSWSLSVRAAGSDDRSAGNFAIQPGVATRFDVVVLPPAAGVVASAQNTSEGFLGKLTHAVALITMPAPRQVQSITTTDNGGGTAPTPAPPVNKIPDALSAPDPAPANDTHTPLANLSDTGWANGNTRETTPIFDTKFFTPEIRFDVNYLHDFNDPHDHTIVGSTEEFRSDEFQIEQVSFGGNFHWDGVQARFLSMMGLFSTATIRNDASNTNVGQWDLADAYRYFSEANAGYHWDDIGHGLNVDAGIFVSYIGLFSYYNFDNWTYQPSFVSSNTPWFFNGLRIQYWLTQDFKIEPWLINGWQSAAKFNHTPGFGGQILYETDNVKWVFNSYFLGEDNLNSGSGVPNNGGGDVAVGTPNPLATYISYNHVHRMHEDDSVVWRYFDAAQNDGKDFLGVSRMALSLTWDFGCEYGGGVTCTGGVNKANFLGAMLYDRFWFKNNTQAITVGGGAMNNPGRYLALLQPINGATAATGSPYFTENPGEPLYQWDLQLNYQYMPKDWITWWAEVTYRHSNVPYWSGPGGVTPPDGNTGAPASYACNNGSIAGVDNCAGEGGIWYPDLRTSELIAGVGLMVKF